MLLPLLITAGCRPSGDGTEELRIYAAVSLREPLLAARGRLSGVAGLPVEFLFGASNDLARQILAAGRGGLFLSADELQMDAVERGGKLVAGTRRIFLSNRLVVVVPAGADQPRIASPEELAAPEIERLSIADPSGVPAGRYAAAWLRSAGLWDRVSSRIVPAIDARAALAAVESGGARAGVVYATDAAISRRVRVAFVVPPGEGPAISYAGAVLAGGGSEQGARRLLDFLSGEGAGETFGSWGFTVP
jgi:molybdate transport system substrate-binding protein